MSKEASSGPSFLRFNLAQSLDVSSVVPPLLAVGVSGYVAVYDLQSNSRVGRVDLKSVPVELAFAPDGSVLIVVVQDWMVYSVSTSSWKSRLLVPRRSKMDKPLSSCMLAVAPGSNPFIYFCRYAKDTLRLATLPSRGGAPAADAAAVAAAAKDGKDGPGRGASSASGWGSRVKLDVQKAILGLACHVVDAQLMVLTADGQLRGYAIAGGGGDVMTPLWAVQVQDAADKVVPPLGILTCVPHPAVAGGALILQGSRTGTATVLEAPGRGTPAQIVRGRVPNWAATLGMGFDKASSTVLAFGLSEGGGRLKSVSWRLGYRLGASGVTMRPSRVEPQDITNMLDSTRRTKAALATSMAAGAVAAAASATGAATSSALQRNLTAGGAAGGAAAGAGANAAPPAWHGLWSVTPGWSHDASSSCLLEGQLAPVVSRVAVHPSLGVIAAATEPSVAVQVNKELLFGGRGALSAEEANLARRTATVSLLTVTNLEAHACGWRGGRAAPQHTSLAAWLPPGAATAAATAAAAAAAAAAGDSSSDDEAPAPADPASDPAAEVVAGSGDSAALQLPPHVYYLAGNRLMKYSLVTRSCGTVAMLPVDAPDGDTRTPRQLVYSSKRAAWLIFFESQAAGGVAASGGGANGAAAAAPERFTWTYVTAAALSVGGSEGGAGPQSWVRAGKYGCFVGPDDEHFAVVSSNGRLLELFDSAAPPGQLAGGRPLLSCVLEGGVLLPGLGAPLFAGPPMYNAPVPEARAPADAAPHDLRRFRGAGCVLWQSADMNLSLATLPALARVPVDAPAPGAAGGGGAAAGDSSDEDADPNADASGAYYPTLGHGHHFGNVGRQASLPLLPNETVLHVAWQSLTLAAPPPPPKAKKPAAAAAVAAEDDAGAEPFRTNSTFAGAAAAIAAATAAAGGVSAAAAAARAPPPGLGGPTDAVAAVLTTQRLMVVTAALRVVASVSLAALGCPAAAAEPLTSVLWAGPMLLATTAAGQVLQLTWTGQLLPVATLSPTGHVALLGVTGDSLLLLRSLLGSPPVGAAVAAAGGNAAAAAALAEAVARPASLLQPLLIGWASLAATGLLSYGGTSGSPSAAAVVRPALRHALASYDASAVTPRGVWALIAAGAWDVAAAVAAHMPPLDAAVKLAAAAAAGEWGGVAAALAAEARRALHAPLPPPRGSELHSKLVAAAAGALFHGQLSKAGELFQAAGEWPAAMILAVCSGNLQGVHAIASKLAGEGGHGAPAGPPSPDAPQAMQLASALRSLYGGSGSGPVADLVLRMEPLQLQAGPQAMPAVGGGPEPELERAEAWALAPPHASPAAVAVAGALPRASVVLTDGELGPIPAADPGRAPAVAYYALTATAAASVAATAAAGGSAGQRPDGGAASGRGAGGTESSSHRGPGGGGTSAGDNLETTSVASSDAAQAAARAEFLGAGGFGALGGGPAIDFSSDDDSDSEATSAAGSSAVGGAGAAAQRRIKIQIRDAKAAAAAGGAAAAGPTGGDGGSLREAAKGLRLMPPGVGGSSRLAVGSGVVPGAAPSTGLTPAPSSGLTPALSATPSGGGAYQFPPGMSSAQLYAGGAALMETGDWRGAAAHFSRAMSVLSHEERAAMDEASRRARLAFCANYYAAVRLLEGVGAGAGGREARLYRYLAALRLDARHGDALLREAISRNKAVRNYRYAGDQLTALIGRVADTAPGDYLAQLQAEIEDCDRHGGGNADLPFDEQTSDWSALVAAAGESGGSKEDVDALVLPLL